LLHSRGAKQSAARPKTEVSRGGITEVALSVVLS
jgi:hypothetical protein